jgi:uncharacterized membrane protein YeaQ/YmgE (transglycosylase-associated protein family)
MNEPLAAISTPHLAFLAQVAIGALSGLVIGKLTGARHWLVTLMLVGVAGAWLGSQATDILGVTQRDSMGHFLAALVGAAAIIEGWRKLHPGDDPGSEEKTSKERIKR